MATDERDTAPKTGNDQALDADSLAGSAEHGGPTMFARIGMLSAEIDASSGSLTHRTKTRIGAAIVEARRTMRLIHSLLRSAICEVAETARTEI